MQRHPHPRRDYPPTLATHKANRIALALCTALFLGSAHHQPALAASTNCFMITYTYGEGNVALEIIHTGNRGNDGPNFAEILAYIREHAQNLGITNTSVTPTGIFKIACSPR